MNRIIFLGSGGGRHMIASQIRKTGGLYFEFGLGEDENFSFVLDPGPGAIVNAVALGLDVQKMKGIAISHHHIDHVTDANAIIDAIYYGDEKSKRFPFLVAEEHCLKQGKGKDDPYPYITKFHQGISKRLFSVKPGDSVKIDKLELHAARAWHYAPTVGFMISYEDYKIGYPADGTYYPGQEKHYEGCDVLILNASWPKGYDAPKGYHMTLDDAIALVRAIQKKPQLVILSHLFPITLRANMYKQERIFQEATKVKCISASDYMELNLDTLNTKILAPVVKP